MKLKKWQKEIREDMDELFQRVPPYQPRSELEMEKIIHKSRVLARKAQIRHMLDDQDIPVEPFNLLTYSLPERRRNLIKVSWELIKYGFLQLKP